MYWNRSASQIAAAWQTEIETKLEAGATPLLLTGTPSLALTGIIALPAYQQLMAQRTDITTPLLVAGGSSALWLGLILAPNERRSTPLPAVVYGGPDPATYLANVQTLSTGRLAPPALAHSGAPAALAPFYAPRVTPAVPAAWETLPFVEVGEGPQPALAPSTLDTDPADDWIAWGTMLLALCLVLSALLI